MTAAAVTPFALAAGLVENVRTLIYSATWVLSPTASELETRGEGDKLHEMMIVGSKYSVLLAWPILAGLIIFGGNFMTTWVGNKYAESARLLTILSVPTLLSLPQSATSSVLYGVSRHKGVVALSIANALVNLALSVWWVRSYGLEGVAFGTAVPLALIGGVATLVYGCYALDLHLWRYLWQGMLQPGLVCLTFVAPALLIQRLAHPVGWVPLGVTCGACWALFAACAWLFGIGPQEQARWTDLVPRLMGRGGTAVATGGPGT
jgi:O-antigen/teichoic acid export membrane protein